MNVKEKKVLKMLGKELRTYEWLRSKYYGRKLKQGPIGLGLRMLLTRMNYKGLVNVDEEKATIEAV